MQGVTTAVASRGAEIAAASLRNVEARWAATPVIHSFSTEFPASGQPALEGFLTYVRGMGRSQWDAYAAGGQVSRYSSNSDGQNLRLLMTGERRTALVDDLGEGVLGAERRALQVEEAGLTAFRYRQMHGSQTIHVVAAAPDAQTGTAIMNVHQARISPEREMALGSLLGYAPPDIAHFVDGRFGYAGVQHLLRPGTVA